MSETITDTTPAADPTPEPPPTPEPQTQADGGGDGGQEPPQTTEQTPEPEPAPKPDKIERRIANLTRKMADEARAREAAERRAEAAEALLRANRPEGDETPPAPRQDTTQDVEARAAQLLQERQFTQRLVEIDTTGKRDLGADAWEQAKATLTSLGAVNNQAFLQALAEAENPAKLFAHYADDTDALMELLSKPPAAMAARIGRLDVELSRPVVKPVSNAPTPATRVRASGVAPEPTIYDYPANMSMKEWNAMMDRVLPPSLGGKRRNA